MISGSLVVIESTDSTLSKLRYTKGSSVHVCHIERLGPYEGVCPIGEGYQIWAILVGLEEAFLFYSVGYLPLCHWYMILAMRATKRRIEVNVTESMNIPILF